MKIPPGAVPATLRSIKAGPLDIGYEESGPGSGWPCILGHGFQDRPEEWARAVIDARKMANS